MPGIEEKHQLMPTDRRRRAPDYTPKDRIFEYLLLWTSVDETAEQVWGVEDATW